MIDKKFLQDLRRNYKYKSLDQKDVELNPFGQFSIWFEEAINSQLYETNAMILDKASKEGKPSVRAL